MAFIDHVFPAIKAEAHCDIPCGIYDPTPAKMAAKTVARMVEQIAELKLPKDDTDKQAINYYQHAIVRRVLVKEQHAEICKRELETLWTDFFKAEHLESFPDLHERFWQATKLCSINKQGIDVKAAQELLAAIDRIAEVFYQVKKAPKRFEAYQILTDNLY